MTQLLLLVLFVSGFDILFSSTRSTESSQSGNLALGFGMVYASDLPSIAEYESSEAVTLENIKNETDIEARFKKAAKLVKYLGVLEKEGKNTKKLDEKDKLSMYGLFKQATSKVEIDTYLPMTIWFDIEAVAKWYAWKAHQNLSKEKAMEQYVNLFMQLAETGNLSEVLETYPMPSDWQPEKK